MDFSYSPKVIDLQQRLTAFMDEHIYPAESVYHAEVDANRAAGNAWLPTKVMEELKAKARAAGVHWKDGAPQRVAAGPLVGRTFVLTGTLPIWTRDEAKGRMILLAAGMATDPLDFAARPRWPLDPSAEPVRGAGVKG